MYPFDPRGIFRCARMETLRKYFAFKCIPIDVPWDRLDETAWILVTQAWERLDRATNLAVAEDLHDFAVMAEPTGIRTLQVACEKHRQEWVSLLGSASDPLDVVIRLYIELPEVWEFAIHLVANEGLPHGCAWQRYNRLPIFTPDRSPEFCSRLLEGLSSFFLLTEGRGRFGVVESTLRTGNSVLFATHLTNYPLVRETLGNSGKLQRRMDNDQLFTVFILCSGQGGQVDICASGGRRVHAEILRIFGDSMDPALDLKAAPSCARSHFRLNHLRRRRPIPFDPAMIEDARIRSFRFKVLGHGRRTVEVEADPNAGPLDIYDVLDHWFEKQWVPPNNIDLQAVTFAVRLPRIDHHRSSFSFFVTRSGSCNLRSLQDHHCCIGETLLTSLRIDVPDSS